MMSAANLLIEEKLKRQNSFSRRAYAPNAENRFRRLITCLIARRQ